MESKRSVMSESKSSLRETSFFFFVVVSCVCNWFVQSHALGGARVYNNRKSVSSLLCYAMKMSKQGLVVSAVARLWLTQLS
jgi:hypothetical protein